MPSRRSTGGAISGSAAAASRRKHSLGNLRRAHPASGATWNVQVVRGKMSSKCLWHACRALILGLSLMLLGAGMATIGYYADHLAIGTEVRGNATVRVKNDLKGFHLNNFAYVGPIVMGFGGFIVVASCVMTFEARDSAAKVVPARLRGGTGASNKASRSNQSSSASQRRGMQAPRWDHHFGVFRSSPADPHAPAPVAPVPLDRDALTAELVKFSKSLSGRHSKSRGTRISNSLVQRATREHVMCSLLQPPTMPAATVAANRMFWHAASFDETAEVQLSRNTERNRRSDTARRHVLARQKPIDSAEEDKAASRDFFGGVGGGSPLGHRRCSTLSDSSYTGGGVRCPSLASRGSSIDSRRIQVDLHSPDVMPKSILRSPKRYGGPSATPSVEKDFRSQLSVCSEPPPVTMRQLSGQSSFEPCFPEETAVEAAEAADLPHLHAGPTPDTASSGTTPEAVSSPSTPPAPPPPAGSSTNPPKRPRPDWLPLSSAATASAGLTATGASSTTTMTRNEFGKIALQRSHSSRTFYRPKSQRTAGLDDSIFFIKSLAAAGTSSSAGNPNELYDSLQVINERRSTLLKADSESQLSERKLSSYSLGMQQIPESSRNTSIDVDEEAVAAASGEIKEIKDEKEEEVEVEAPPHETSLQME